MNDAPDHAATTSDGRTLNIWLSGADDGHALLFHRGTPDPPARWPMFDEAAAAHGLRVVSYARPGYSGSTRHRGRVVADAAADAETVLDALDIDDFLTIGHSGGGPHALACGALLSNRCRAVVTVASVAPYGVDGLDWLAGMAEENITEFDHALEGEGSYRAFLESELETYREVTAEDVAVALRGLLSDVDKEVLTGEMAELSAQNLHRVARDGIEGWLDDGLAFVRPWGFTLDHMKSPIAVWQGRHDNMVPYAHGEWLSAHIPGARPRMLPEEGHISMLTRRLSAILDDVIRLAGF